MQGWDSRSERRNRHRALAECLCETGFLLGRSLRVTSGSGISRARATKPCLRDEVKREGRPRSGNAGCLDGLFFALSGNSDLR